MTIRFIIWILICLVIKIKYGEGILKNIETPTKMKIAREGRPTSLNDGDLSAEDSKPKTDKGRIVEGVDNGEKIAGNGETNNRKKSPGNGETNNDGVLTSTAFTPSEMWGNQECSYTFKVSSMAVKSRCAPPKNDRRCSHKKLKSLQKNYTSVSMNVLKLEEKIKRLEDRLEIQSGVISKLQQYAYTEECDRMTGWIRYNNSCYWFSPRDYQTSWMNSNIICKSLHEGASLTVLNDEEEAGFVLAHADMVDRQSFWWIGCQKTSQVREWTCVDGLALGFIRWSNNRPTNYPNDRCLQLWNLPRMEFTDTQCNQKWSFVCEKKINRLFK